MEQTYEVLGTRFKLKSGLPIEDAFMAAVDAVNHYMTEDAAAGELYAHPLLKQAWTVRLFMQYYTDLDFKGFEAEDRNPIYVLLQWSMENEALDQDAVIRVCFNRFKSMVDEIETTMKERYQQRRSAGNQLRRLIDFVELRDNEGNGGWNALKETLAGHMLDAQANHQGDATVDLRLFQKIQTG